MIIKMEHIRGVCYCRKGTKEFFERHGLDWKKFLAEGIPEEGLLATNDAMAAAVVEFARKHNAQQ